MTIRRLADWLLCGATFACAAGWTLLFFWYAVESTGFLFRGMEQGWTALQAVVAFEPCLALFERAARTLLQFIVEFAMYVALAWAGVEMFRRSLARKLVTGGPHPGGTPEPGDE